MFFTLLFADCRFQQLIYVEFLGISDKFERRKSSSPNNQASCERTDQFVKRSSRRNKDFYQRRRYNRHSGNDRRARYSFSPVLTLEIRVSLLFIDQAFCKCCCPFAFDSSCGSYSLQDVTYLTVFNIFVRVLQLVRRMKEGSFVLNSYWVKISPLYLQKVNVCCICVIYMYAYKYNNLQARYSTIT